MTKPFLDLDKKLLKVNEENYKIISDGAKTGACIIAKKLDKKIDEYILYWNDEVIGAKDNCLILNYSQFLFLKDCIYDFTKREIKEKDKKIKFSNFTLIFELHKGNNNKIYMLFKKQTEDEFFGFQLSDNLKKEIIEELKSHKLFKEIDFIEKTYDEIIAEQSLAEPLD